MKMPNFESRKLAQAYITLELARDVARRHVEERSSHAVLQPLMTMLGMTATLLEDVLESALPDEGDLLEDETISSSSAELVM